MGIAFTVIENKRGPAAKTFSLKPDGSLDKRSAAQIFEGTAERVEVKSLEEFIECRAGLSPNQALIYGVTKAPSARIVTQRDLPRSPGAIARDRDHFEFAEGQPGILMLDHDPRLGEARTAEEIDAISCAAVPEIAAVQRVWVPSSSAFIYDAEGRELIGRGGWRLYLAVDDASRIPDVGALIYQALWKAAYGYVSVTSSGAILDRSIVDASVWQPERLDFAASPILGPGLERRAPAPLILPGEPMLRTAGLKLDMSMAEWRKTSVQLASAKATAKPEAEKARKAFIRDRIAEYKRRGIYSKHVKCVLNEAVINRKLRADFELVTENGDRVTVKQVLADPARYAGMRFADPLEPNYRDDRRIAYVSLGHDPCLYSHAHGGIRYRLCNQTDEVKVVAGERARVVDETVDIMQHRGDLFERVGGLVQVVGQNIHPMDEPKLSYYLNSIIIYLKAYEVKDGFEWLPIDVQPPVVKEVLAKLIWGLRELLHVITAPTLRTDGTILCEPGYDEKTGLMLVGQNFPPIAARPAEWQLRLAWETLWRPISEFPFATRQDRGVMVAAILTALVRHLFPTAPGFNFDAPVAGTGKTLLASFIQALCGMQPSAIPQTKDEEEMRKRLTSVLRAGDPAILLDNIRGDFNSATLEALITSQVFKDRELGGNKMLSLPTSVMILLSGNNLRLGGDLYRRVLTCRIDAKTETPERRSFALEPVQYCIEHRQELVAAGLTLLRGFIAAGSPRDTYAGGKLGSFERWDGLIRQCVLWLNREGIAELGDPIHCVERAKADEPERRALAAFVQAVHERRGTNTWQVKDLVLAAEAGTDLHDALTEIAGDRHSFKSIDARKLGRWIAAHRGTRSGGLYIEQREQSEKSKTSARWYVCSERSAHSGVDANSENPENTHARYH